MHAIMIRIIVLSSGLGRRWLGFCLNGGLDMAESMKDFERELEASFKRIDEGDIISGTVVSVDESGVVLDLKFYAEGFIPVEEFSRVPGFNIKEAVQPGDEVQAMVLRRDDGQGNILLSRADAADVLAWDRLKELQDSGEVLDVVVKGIVNGGAIAYVEGVRGFIPASRLDLEFVEDTEVFLNKPIQVRVIEADKAKKRLIRRRRGWCFRPGRFFVRGLRWRDGIRFPISRLVL